MKASRQAYFCRGSIMPMATVGMLAFFGMAALGVDTGLAFWDKARLQNAIDAAALSAAKQLDETGSTGDATTAGNFTFNQNANAAGNASLATAVTNGFAPTYQYSTTLNPFTPGPNGPYVRAIGNDLVRNTILGSIFNVNVINVDATAVAGPSPTLGQVCDVAPVMVCGDPAINNPPQTILGYNVGQEYDLKLAAGHDSTEITPGNFHLIRVGAPGGSNVRENFAGLFEQCLDLNNAVDTEPGNTIGPTSQGTDTRFEPCRPPLQCDLDGDGSHDILPDMVATENITYAAYQARYASKSYDYPPPNGEAERRILKVPIADCSTMGPGQTTVNLLGVGCFFMTKKVPNGGPNAYLTGEFIGDGCSADGVAGPNPGGGPGPYKIILYKDPDGAAS